MARTRNKKRPKRSSSDILDPVNLIFENPEEYMESLKKYEELFDPLNYRESVLDPANLEALAKRGEFDKINQIRKIYAPTKKNMDKAVHMALRELIKDKISIHTFL